MNSLLNVQVSYYPNIATTTNGIPVNLLAILQSQKHKTVIENLRAQPDQAKQKQIKSTLPCYTVAGVFSTRSNTGLITPSNLACVDLDAAEDYNIPHLLTELRKLPCIAYAGLSCRGKRLFLIVPFGTPDYHRHYERLIQSFTQMGLPMGDSCHKAISQPRLVSHNTDTTQWFNHQAQPYALLPPVRSFHVAKKFTGPPPPAVPDFKRCVDFINTQHVFKNGRHRYIVALAGYCRFRQLSWADTLNGCLNFGETGFDRKEITAIVKYFYEMPEK